MGQLEFPGTRGPSPQKDQPFAQTTVAAAQDFLTRNVHHQEQAHLWRAPASRVGMYIPASVYRICGSLTVVLS